MTTPPTAATTAPTRPALTVAPNIQGAQAALAERDRASAAGRAAPANVRATLNTPVRDTPPPMLPRLPAAEPGPTLRPAPNYATETPAAPGRPGAQRAPERVVPADPVPQQVTTTGNPREQCGNRILLALHLCLVRQCVKPEYTAHEECVRVRQIEERAARTPG